MRVLLLALLSILALASPALAAPSIWVVHAPGCTLTLFGSIHVLPKGLDWRPPALDAALSQADELWFEIPLGEGSEQQAAAAALARGALPEGQRLLDLLPADEGRRLAAFAKANTLSMDRLDRMQPWFADMVVSSVAYTRLGASDGAGVEQTLANAAPQAARRAFETAEQQIALLADAPAAVQVQSLDSSLKEAAQDPDEYKNLVSAWLRGDGRTIYRHDVLGLKRDTPALFGPLIEARNAAWTRTLAERLKRPGHVVVVVGAGHLLGPGGVPARLRALGYQVDGPKD
ncbi:MAG TPA: TraB/GumN family protein [Caulobacteraceae bacterium]|nr:TraB/GumN family protein [Caulobacteraceae bacterium]